MDKKYGRYEWEDSSTNFESALEAFEDFLQIVYNLTVNKYLDNKTRRTSVKIHDYDTWSMDNTLAHIIVPMLKHLKDTKHGVPFTDMEDVPENCRFEDKEGEIEWMQIRWDYIIDEMIWAFEQKNVDWEEDFYSFADDHKLGDKPLRWDNDGIKAHQARMTNGFRLFGKYYESLWS
jgi:hypothetical protein